MYLSKYMAATKYEIKQQILYKCFIQQKELLKLEMSFKLQETNNKKFRQKQFTYDAKCNLTWEFPLTNFQLCELKGCSF